MAFPRSSIDFVGNDVALLLGQAPHAFPFRQILADQSVGVFVGPALPGMVWACEVHGGSGGGLDNRIAMELGAIV